MGFALDLSDIDLWNIDLLDTDITSKILLASETSWRRLQDMSSRSLQDMPSRHLQDMSSRIKLLRWRRAEDVFKTSWRPTNVCWDISYNLKEHIWNLIFIKSPYSMHGNKSMHSITMTNIINCWKLQIFSKTLKKFARNTSLFYNKYLK